MNIFGAIAVIVTVFGALVGALFFDIVVLRNRTVPFRWLFVSIAGLAFGYIVLKAYRRLLRGPKGKP